MLDFQGSWKASIPANQWFRPLKIFDKIVSVQTVLHPVTLHHSNATVCTKWVFPPRTEQVSDSQDLAYF